MFVVLGNSKMVLQYLFIIETVILQVLIYNRFLMRVEFEIYFFIIGSLIILISISLIFIFRKFVYFKVLLISLALSLFSSLLFVYNLNVSLGLSSKYEDNSEIYVRIIGVNSVENENIKYLVRSADGVRLFIKGERHVERKVGDVCVLEGNVIAPYTFDEFDYPKYLYSNSIYYSYKLKDMNCEGDKRYSIYSLFRIKESLSNAIYSSVPSPYAEFMIGILWGDNLSFDPSTSDLFVLTGTTHIIAASGFNVSIIIGILNMYLFFLDRKSRDIIISIFLIIYSFFGGFSPSITRSVVMNEINIGAYNFGFPIEPIISFIYSISIILFFKPNYIYNISFLLSAFATLGIIIIPVLLNMTILKRLGEGFINTLSATIATLPISIIVFKKFSLMSVFINSMLLFIINDIMIISIIGSVVFYINRFLGEKILCIGMYISHTFLFLLNLLSNIFLKLGIGVINMN